MEQDAKRAAIENVLNGKLSIGEAVEQGQSLQPIIFFLVDEGEEIGEWVDSTGKRHTGTIEELEKKHCQVTPLIFIADTSKRELYESI